MKFNVSETKAVGHKFNATINDVLVSCVTGALRRTMESETQSKVPLNTVIRAGIPIDMRSSNQLIKSTR